MYVAFGNFYYFLYFALGIIITIGMIFFLKNKDDNFKHKVITILLFSALALHFAKLLFSPYNQMLPQSIRKVSFENICAVSTLVFPFIYLSKNKVLLDYMLVMGIASGVAAFIYPTEAMLDTFDSIYFGMKGAFSFDVIRFYLAHYIIFLVPFLLGYFELHVLKLKRLVYLPLTIMGTLALIFLNEYLLLQLGWIDKNMFYDVNIRNSSLVFGIPDYYEGIGPLFDIFVFKFLKTNPVTHEPFYWPVIWMTIPVIIWTPIVTFVSNSPFLFKRVLLNRQNRKRKFA